MSGAQGAQPKESYTATTYESKDGGENKPRTDLYSKEDEGYVEVDKIQEKVEDPVGKGGPVFGAGKDDDKEDLGVTGTAPGLDCVVSETALNFLDGQFLAATQVDRNWSLGKSETCPDCFIHSRAGYYPNSDQKGTEVGECGFGKFGATLNGGDVSAASELYRGGVGCGACYQVRCTYSYYCLDKGVTVVITDHGISDRTDFILSQRAFSQMAQSTDAAASLLALGIVDIEYRRVSCSYPNKNITFKIDESSNNPYYLAFEILYQQGKMDITAVQLCETQNFVCKLLDRTHGAVWTTTSPPSGPLSIRMLFSANDEDQTWVVPVNNIPGNWKPGDTYDSGVQVNA